MVGYVHKVAIAALAATALAGAGVGAAGPSTVEVGPQLDVRFFNASPYQMIITRVGDPNDPYADLANPIAPAISPGQSLTMSKADLARARVAPTHVKNSQLEVAEVDQGSGVMDLDAIQVSGYQPGMSTCMPAPGRTMVKEMGCIVQTPDVQAGESGPMQVSIWTTNPSHYGQATSLDANTGDKASMGNFLSALAVNRSWVTFQPDVDTVSWGSGEPTQAGQAVWNCGSGDANEQVGGAATHEESTNVTGSLGIANRVKLFGAVNASISAGPPWTTSTSDSNSASENIASHDVGWLDSIPSTETVSGSVTATTMAGYPVVFSHISFTEPGVDKTNDPGLEYEYVARSRAMTSDEITTHCGSSSAANATNHDGIVIGGSIPDAADGAR